MQREQTWPNVCVVGAGAVGGLLGTRLAAAGVRTSALARGATLEALRRNGWRLRDGDHEITAPVRASDDPHELGAADVLFVAVKAQLMIELTRAGLAAVRAAGRPTVMTSDRLDIARQLIRDGQTIAAAARVIGVSRSTLSRHLSCSGPSPKIPVKARSQVVPWVLSGSVVGAAACIITGLVRVSRGHAHAGGAAIGASTDEPDRDAGS